jgi:hypothetical protein
VINSQIRASYWMTFPLTVVNFNHFFIQPAPDCESAWLKSVMNCKIPCIYIAETQRSRMIMSKYSYLISHERQFRHVRVSVRTSWIFRTIHAPDAGIVLLICTIYNIRVRVVSDIQTLAFGSSLYIRYNTDANVVNDLKNDSFYEFIGEVILKINVV